MSETLRFQSTDEKFGLLLGGTQVKALLRFARASKSAEMGGVLVGFYSDALDCAHVTKLSSPPRDSHADQTTFERGTRGLEGWLSKLWKAPRRTYYLGEWHFHPRASPEASPQDCAQMVQIASNGAYACPEPLLLILGGDPCGQWDARAYVFPLRQGCTPLRRILLSTSQRVCTDVVDHGRFIGRGRTPR